MEKDQKAVAVVGSRSSLCELPAMDFITGPARGVAKNNDARNGNTRRATHCVRRFEVRFRLITLVWCMISGNCWWQKKSRPPRRLY